jgi:hypothetical protein
LEVVPDAQAIIATSRAKYATPRAEVEATLLANFRSDTKKPEPPESDGPPSSKQKPTPKPPPTAPSNLVPTAPPTGTAEVAPPSPSPIITPAAEPPKTTVSGKEKSAEPKDLGRGGARHKTIQSRLKTEAHKLGFQAEVEKQLASGSNDAADLVLLRGPVEIAVEITITTGVDHEFENVKKCLAAGFKRVAVVATGRKHLESIATAVRGGLGPEAAAKVGYHTPDEFLAELQKLAKATEAPPPSEPMAKTGKVLGFEITRNFPKQSPEEQRLNQQAIHEVTRKAIKS